MTERCKIYIYSHQIEILPAVDLGEKGYEKIEGTTNCQPVHTLKPQLRMILL